MTNEAWVAVGVMLTLIGLIAGLFNTFYKQIDEVKRAFTRELEATRNAFTDTIKGLDARMHEASTSAQRANSDIARDYVRRDDFAQMRADTGNQLRDINTKLDQIRERRT